MAAKTTKEVFDMYFSTFDPKTVRKIKGSVDRKEVYEYEERLGKQIFDMNLDELLDMIQTFHRSRTAGKKGQKISYSTVDQIISQYRLIWNFYIDNIELIKNPWYDKKTRGIVKAKAMSKGRQEGSFLSHDMFEKVLYQIRQESDEPSKRNYGMYLECLLLLYYHGFANAEEIILLKEDMIDFDNHEIHFDQKTLHLSDRCFYLLTYIHSLTCVKTSKGIYSLVPWHDGYFKVAIRDKSVAAFQEKTSSEAGTVITRKIVSNVRERLDVNASYHAIYYLGFYDYVVSKAGEQRTLELITSVRNSKDAQELLQYAKEFGIASKNVTQIKSWLRPYIK